MPVSFGAMKSDRQKYLHAPRLSAALFKTPMGSHLGALEVIHSTEQKAMPCQYR